MCHKLPFRLYLLIPEVSGTEHVFRFPCGSCCWGEHIGSQEGHWEGERGLPCRQLPRRAPLPRRGCSFPERAAWAPLTSLCTSVTCPAVEKMKLLSPFASGLVLVYGLIFGHAYFCVPASADIIYIDLNWIFNVS